MKLIIVADDLTGAADCAARCHTAGLSATILVNSQTAAMAQWPDRDVVALNFDSRHLSPTAAAERVRTRLAPLAAAAQPVIWYKKIDSTLRGNIGAELEAMLPLITPAGQQPCAIISPAFPAQRRGLQQGMLVYELSTAARHLPSMLAEQSALPVALIELKTVRQGTAQLAQQLQQQVAAGTQLLVVDGMSDCDLQTIVQATRQTLPQALLCGSAGMVLPLATLLRPNLPETVRLPRSERSSNTHTLVIVGSASEMAHRQIATVARDGRAAILVAQDATADTPAIGSNCLLHLPKPDIDVAVEGATARQMAGLLVNQACQQIEEMLPQSLILVGGDTAQLTMAQLGIQQLDVIDECQPGMPLSIGVDAKGIARQIILKAGNHGDEESLLNLLMMLSP